MVTMISQRLARDDAPCRYYYFGLSTYFGISYEAFAPGSLIERRLAERNTLEALSRRRKAAKFFSERVISTT